MLILVSAIVFNREAMNICLMLIGSDSDPSSIRQKGQDINENWHKIHSVNNGGWSNPILEDIISVKSFRSF